MAFLAPPLFLASFRMVVWTPSSTVMGVKVMRYALIAFILATMALGATAASAGRISGDCWTAARLGGPCGCEAAKLVGRGGDRSLWAVSSWYRFPRTGCHPGAAAIWPGRHVEIVTSCNSDGTANTTGSVGFSHARIAVFVEPSGRTPQPELSRVAQRTFGIAPQRVAYHRAAPVHYAYHGPSKARYAAHYHQRYAVAALARYASHHRVYARVADAGHVGSWR